MGSITADSLYIYNNTTLNGNLNCILNSNFIGNSTFSSNLYGQDASFNKSLHVGTNLIVGGTSNLNTINGTSIIYY